MEKKFRAITPSSSPAVPATSKASPPPPHPFSLAHPATPAAEYLSERHLAPFVSRGGAAADLLARYEPVTSRGGLVVLLRRRHANVPRELGICVYDPMSGGRAFLSDPPEMSGCSPGDGFRTYVLLTASDGIGYSFLLLAVDFTMLSYGASSVKVLTVLSPDAAGGGSGEWSPVTSADTHLRSHCIFLHADCSAVVLGSAVHWVMIGGRDRLQVLTYDVRAATAGSIELPIDRLPKSYRKGDFNLHLASSPEGKLTVLVRDRLTISVWRLLSTGAAGWERHAVIDTEAMLRSLALELTPSWPWAGEKILIVSLGERSSVLLFELLGDCEERRIALDVQTKEMHMVNRHRQEGIQAFPFEVDLEFVSHEILLVPPNFSDSSRLPLLDSIFSSAICLLNLSD